MICNFHYDNVEELLTKRNWKHEETLKDHLFTSSASSSTVAWSSRAVQCTLSTSRLAASRAASSAVQIVRSFRIFSPDLVGVTFLSGLAAPFAFPQAWRDGTAVVAKPPLATADVPSVVVSSFLQKFSISHIENVALQRAILGTHDASKDCCIWTVVATQRTTMYMSNVPELIGRSAHFRTERVIALDTFDCTRVHSTKIFITVCRKTDAVEWICFRYLRILTV